MTKLEIISQIHSLATTAHTIIYIISNFRYETNLGVDYEEQVNQICKDITRFARQTSEKYDEVYDEEKKPF